MDTFVHLHTQSAFSYLWGTFLPEALAERAAQIGMSAVALTDYGLHGAVRFCKAAETAGIQPIVGAVIPIEESAKVTLLVQNAKGFANLCRLLSLVYQSGFQPDRLVSDMQLARYSDGLICLAGGWPSGEMVVRRGGPSALERWLTRLRAAFTEKDALFVALQNLGRKTDRHLMETMIRVAKRLGLPIVATGPVVCLEPEDAEIHHALVGIRNRYHHQNITPIPSGNLSLLSGNRMARLVPEPEALANTRRIAEACRGWRMPLGGGSPPNFENNKNPGEWLSQICQSELTRRFPSAHREYRSRLESELAAIGRMGLAGYFLLVKDVVDFARSANIRHSVRGSAAGSLVVHLTLGGVDPVANGLLFERFINDGRRDLPDVDVDFDSERRDEVIHYLMDKYPGGTAMVSTAQTLRVRSAVRMAAIALGYMPEKIEQLTECLPVSFRGGGLTRALEALPELADSPLKREVKLTRLADRLSRLPFQPSVHLGGVLIAPGDVMNFTPVGLSTKGFPVGHLDKDDAEALGLLKLDLLGLRMHTAIGRALEVLSRRSIRLEPDRLPLDDPKTYALLRTTRTVGVFQIESPGQRQLLGKLQPRNFQDMIAQISLFRPGPVEGNMVDPFVRRRNGTEVVRHLHPFLAPILKETYGVILFQEHVLRIAHTFAGLSYNEADVFRRTMTKDRKSKKMKELCQRFLRGAIANGHSRELAETVFNQILSLAAYGFCKAHAASFAHITYQSAWLKANHPQAFFIGLLNAGRVGSYPASVVLNEAKRSGIPVLPPHVNRSDYEYEAEGNGIRVPLSVINGIGGAQAWQVVKQRRAGGPYLDAQDLRKRTGIPENLIRNIALAGALDGPQINSGLFEGEKHV